MPMGYSYIVNRMERKGESESIIAETRSLLDEFDDKVISDTTGLSLEKVEKIRRENNEY